MIEPQARKAYLKKRLLSIRRFSRDIIQKPALRQYQIEPAQAVLESVLQNRGLEFLWIFPRQSGKDEAIAQLCVQLLARFSGSERGHIVHVYPTGGQLATGVARLEARLQNWLTHSLRWDKGLPLRRGVGQAQVCFTSAGSKIEGLTANALLIINETQDQVEEIISRRFEPMRASTNATQLFVGTVRTASDYLWRTRTRLKKLEALDGLKRVFEISIDQIAPENPAYKTFVDNQVRLKGREHPAIKTEYFNETIDTAASLFPPRRRQLLLGQHRRLTQPQPGERYLALIDLGGQDEQPTTNDLWLFKNSSRDYTVVTIVRVHRSPASPPPDSSFIIHNSSFPIGNLYEVVDVAVFQGNRHFQSSSHSPSLFDQALAFLNHWNAAAVICDQTGLGQGFTDALMKAYHRPVFGFTFSSLSKAALGNDFLALIETGRFKYFGDEHDRPGADAWWFLLQAEHCGYELAPGQPIERGLRWGVPDAARIRISAGETLPIHDDRLVSAALCAEADRLYREGKLFLSTSQSTVIKRDLMGDIDRRRDWN